MAATCSDVNPVAITNKAARIGQKPFPVVLATTARQPNAISASDPAIVSTAPKRLLIHADGNDSRPLARKNTIWISSACE